MLAENYHSGSDVSVVYAGIRFDFHRLDFRERVLAAAERLGLTAAPAAADEADDLVEAAIRGAIGTPRTALGERIAPTLVEPHGPVYWLRKLVIRSAWTDQRVVAGLVEPRFDESSGRFRYVADGFRLPAWDADVPSFATAPERSGEPPRST